MNGDRSYIPGNISGSVWHFAKHNNKLQSQEADMHFVISDDFEKELDKTPRYGIVGGICTANSVATIQYTGLDSGFIMAHEIGHAFGCKHDYDTNCRYDDGGVMASRPKIDRLRKLSTCSADTISQKLRKKNSVLGPYCDGTRIRLGKCQTDKSQEELERWYADVNAEICRKELE
ncbi:unnamed protein product [Gordionus sp. m RMFG-2023]